MITLYHRPKTRSSRFLWLLEELGAPYEVKIEEAMPFVIETLTANPYVLGTKFSGADILYATTFAMFGASPMMPKSPVVDDYVKRCLKRPAYARAQAREEG